MKKPETDFERGFLAGAKAAVDRIAESMVDDYEIWGQCDRNSQADYAKDILKKINFGGEVSTIGKLFGDEDSE